MKSKKQVLGRGLTSLLGQSVDEDEGSDSTESNDDIQDEEE